MMADPYTIRIFVPDGDPEGLRLIDRMNWTGQGIVIPREGWAKIKVRQELAKPGVYVLVGYVGEDDDLPTLYIGQGDVVRNRIDSHAQNKDFWSKAIVFVSGSGGLNRAHATWLEYALIRRALSAKQCHLENGTEPQEPALSEAEKADMHAFLKEMLQILPLVGINAFETPKAVAVPMAKSSDATKLNAISGELNTIIVPAQKEGFEKVFLGENAWYAIRISGGMLPKIKYIAAYQSQPISAATHFAPVALIEPHGDSGNIRLSFRNPRNLLGPSLLAMHPRASCRGRGTRHSINFSKQSR